MPKDKAPEAMEDWEQRQSIKAGREVVRRYEEGDKDFQEARLRGVALGNADLHEVNLGRADLSRANLSGANLSGANLRAANLSHANLGGADLCGANLREADLSGAKLWEADLSRANLGGANLSAANLSDAKLRDANLRGADLRTAIMGSFGPLKSGIQSPTDIFMLPADLSRADLSRADLRGANLRGADLSGAKLWEADLGGVDLEGATASEEQLAEVASLERAIMPDGRLRLKRWERGSVDSVQTDASEVIPTSIRQAVLDRDDYLCRYCGCRSQTMEIDHIIPVSQGGDSTLDNLVTACRRCNRKKAARTPEEAGMTVLPVRTEKRR